MYLRDACKIATQYGDTLYNDCPGNDEIPQCYNIASEIFRDEEAMKKASDFRTQSYYSCKTIDEIKYALMNYGPLLASLKWYSDYKTTKDGVLIGGASNDYGYHAIVVYGFNEIGFLCQNSWGRFWGNDGRFIVPYSIKFEEARGLIDMNNDTYITPPKPNKYLNALYKMINFIINLCKKLKK